ncbi:MAG: AI-2E family transporter [Candidatus Pacebacteria bacterium]|nr:AI-2E family transporter [Candidatus Paceibacterota bacterium]
MQTKIIERYFFFGLFLTTFVFTFLIFKPFWIVLVLSICFAIVLYPVYEWLKRRHMPSWLASLLTVLLFAVMLLGPISGIGVLVFNQSQDVYNSIVEGQGVGPFIDSIGNGINDILPNGISVNIKEKASDFALLVSNNVAKIFSTTLSTFFSLTLIFLSLFYFLKDGARWRQALVELSPLSDRDDKKIIIKLERAVNGVIKGYLLIAVIQGLLMAVGFAIFGIPNGALWGVVAAIASLVPMIGTAFVSVPAILFLFATGHDAQAIGFLIWCVIIVGTVDNLLNPYIVGSKVNIPPLFILFAVLGGIAVLGPVGVLVGPLAVSLLYTLISIYKSEFKEDPVIQ